MPKRIANNTIILTRKEGRVRVPAGKLFDFTNEELADLKESAPNSIRTPRNEVESVQEVVAPKAEGKQGGKQGKQGKQQQAESKPEGEEGGAGGEGGSGEEEL